MSSEVVKRPTIRSLARKALNAARQIPEGLKAALEWISSPAAASQRLDLPECGPAILLTLRAVDFRLTGNNKKPARFLFVWRHHTKGMRDEKSAFGNTTKSLHDNFQSTAKKQKENSISFCQVARDKKQAR
jgi:hypothetical protein